MSQSVVSRASRNEWFDLFYGPRLGLEFPLTFRQFECVPIPGKIDLPEVLFSVDSLKQTFGMFKVTTDR